MTNKKGNINELFPAVLALILVGALLCIGILILTSFQSTTFLNTATVSNNETLAIATTSGIHLAAAEATHHGVCGALTNVVNTTGNVRLGVSNFTQVGCLVKNATDLSDFTAGATLKYTYPYTFDNATATSTAIGSVNTSLATLATTWLPIIVVVIAAAIVLAILLGAFGGKRK